MKLLKNERAYRRWSTEKYGWDTYGDRWRNEAPTEYPCYAYTFVSDFGMEELSPVFLYAADIAMMMQEMEKASP